MLGRLVLILILFLASVFTGVSIVYSKHSMRKAFFELQVLQNKFDDLQIEWGRLQLEQSTWAAHGRVERLAREKLEMDLVDMERLVFLKTQ